MIFSVLKAGMEFFEPMPFRSNLSKIMTEKNVTYEELQFAANITPRTVARARDERIATCTLATLGKIAKALNVDVHSLFTYIPKK